MPIEVGEMTFLEQLAKQFDIPTPEYLTADAPRSEIRSALERWGGKWIVKPDILAGKRGKAGKVSVVTTAAEAIRRLKLAAAAEINGRNARTAYMVQYVPSEQEVYTAITYDSRWLGPALTISMAGGRFAGTGEGLLLKHGQFASCLIDGPTLLSFDMGNAILLSSSLQQPSVDPHRHKGHDRPDQPKTAGKSTGVVPS